MNLNINKTERNQNMQMMFINLDKRRILKMKNDFSINSNESKNPWWQGSNPQFLFLNSSSRFESSFDKCRKSAKAMKKVVTQRTTCNNGNKKTYLLYDGLGYIEEEFYSYSSL